MADQPAATAWAEIYPDALTANIEAVRECAPGTKVMAMAKADAYGHGLKGLMTAFANADGIGVARAEEAVQLREWGWQKPLLLMGTRIDQELIKSCVQNDIWLTVHDIAGLEALEQRAKAGKHLPGVWLKLNSGMQRLGLREADFVTARQRLKTADQSALRCEFTHFAAADDCPEHAREQLQVFEQSRDGKVPASVANSAAILRGIGTDLEWVRPGIMLYGADPITGGSGVELAPVMHFKSRVIAVNRVNRGETVGYGRAWTAAEDGFVAYLGVGYGDGYPRQASAATEAAQVSIKGLKLPLAGRVSMDIVAVDLGANTAAVKPGDSAELWGSEVSANAIADCAKTISYHLFTGVTGRVPRILIRND